MKNSFKLLAIAASITLAGCASTPYNAGQYALENQRLASETSLEAVEPDEHFSEAMKIMYDYSGVDIDYKNNLDKPYLKNGSSFKDFASLGGTTALIFSGAGLADIASFGLGTSYRKEIDVSYTQNLYMRYIPLKDATSQPELNNVININRKQMAKNIENAYKRDGVSLKFFSPKRKVFVDNSQADETLFIIPTYEDKGLGAKLCRKHGSELQEHLNKYGYIMGGNCYASTEPFSFNQTPVVRVNDNGSTIEAVDGAIAGQYLVLYSYLPDDFPVAYLASNNANDLVYRPSFLWLEKNSSYVKLYTPEVMVERLKKGHVSQEPVLKQLDSESQVPFLFQQQ